MLQQTEWVAEFAQHLESLCRDCPMEPDLVWQIASEQYGYHQDWPPQYSAQVYFSRYRRHRLPLVYDDQSSFPESAHNV